MKLYLILIPIFISQLIHSQKAEISEKEKDMFYSFVFDKTKKLFKKPEYNFKSQKLDIDKKFIKSTKTKESIISSIEYFEKMAEVKIINEKTKKIKLISNFPENFLKEKLNIISIELEDIKLVGNDNNQLKTLDAEFTTFGLNVTNSNQLSFDSKVDENLKGEVSYRLKFITDYSYKKISKNDIGKTIKLSDSKYKIIDLFENKIILKPNLNKNLTVNNLKIKSICIDKKGTMELSSTNFWNLSSWLIKEEIYHLLKENKDFNLDIFKDKVPFNELIDKKLLGKYIVMEVPAPIENQVILYEPIYGVDRIIKVKL